MPCHRGIRLPGQWRPHASPLTFSHLTFSALAPHPHPAHRRWNIPVAEERRLALERLRTLCQSGNFSILDFRHAPLRIFAAHEVAALCEAASCSDAGPPSHARSVQPRVPRAAAGQVAQVHRTEVPRRQG